MSQDHQNTQGKSAKAEAGLRPKPKAAGTQMKRQLAGLSYVDQVQLISPKTGGSGGTKLCRSVQASGGGPSTASVKERAAKGISGPGSSGAAVQKTEAAGGGGGGAPEMVILRLAAQVFRVRLPANPKKTVNLTINQTVGAFTLKRARITFDDSWEVKSGTVNGEANFAISGAECRANLSLRVGRNGQVRSSAANADIQAGPLSGTCKLKIGQGGVSGKATITVNNDIRLTAGAASLTLTQGAQATVKIANSGLKSAHITALKGFVGDEQGKLVEIDGQARYSASRITASGKATLVRSLSKSLGGFELTLKQGDTQGQISVVGTKIKKLTADFAVDVTHSRFGPIGTGHFNGTYANDGKEVHGRGDFALGPNDLTFGNTAGFHVIAARAGSSIGVSVARGGQPKLHLNVESTVKMGERVLASGSAQNVVYDGTDLSGDFSLTIAVGFSFGVGPLTVSVKSADGVSLSYKGGELEVSGGNLSVDLDWAGKTFGLKWPKWKIALGELGPLPSLELPDFDLSGFFDWFKGLGGFSLDWVFNLFKRLSIKLPQFNGTLWPRFLAWLRRFRLPLPSIPLLGLPSFDINLVIGKFWDGLLDFFGTFNFNIALPKLKELFLGLDLGSFNFDWFNGWFANSNLGLQTDGNFDIALNGENFPTITGTNLSATLLWKGNKIATLAAPNMSFDGTTFKAWLNLTFERDFGIPAGRYKLCLKRIGVELALQSGQPYQLTIPTIDLELKEGRKKVAVGCVNNIQIGESGVSFAESTFGMTAKKKIPLGGAGAYTFFLKARSAITGEMSGTELATIKGENVGIEVKKGGKKFADGGFSVDYDTKQGMVRTATGTVTLKKPIKPMDGLKLSKGRITAHVANNNLTRIELNGVKATFDKTLGGKRISVRGSVNQGVYNAETETLESLDATLNIARPITIGPRNARISLKSGDFHLLVAGGQFQRLDFTDLALTAKLGGFELEGNASGAITENGVTVSESLLTLKKGRMFGTTTKGLKIHDNASMGVTVKDSVLESVALRETGVTVFAGPVNASGFIEGTFDGQTITEATAKVVLNDPISIGNAQWGGTLKANAEVGATVANGEVTEVTWTAVGFDVNVRGVGFSGETTGKWTPAGIDIHFGLGLAPESIGQEIPVGNFALTPTAGSVFVDVEQSQLKKVGVPSLGAKVRYQSGENNFALDLSFTEGSWDATNGLSGTATVGLDAPIPLGSAVNQVLLESGSASIVLANDKLKSLCIANLFGKFIRNGEELAMITVTEGTYDFELGKVTSATIGFMMSPGKCFRVGKRVTVQGIIGGFTLANDLIELSGAGQIDVDFGEGKGLSGFLGVNWKQGPEGGMGDFAGTRGSVSGVLIKDEAKGRLLEAKELAVEIADGNVPLIGGGVNFSIDKDMGGSADLATLQEGDKLVPVITGGSFSFQRDLIAAKTLLDIDFANKRPGLAPKARGGATVGIEGGLKLGTDALRAGTSIALTEPWRPLDGRLPTIDSNVEMSWGLDFSGELLAKLGLILPILPPVDLLINLSGGVGGGVKVNINPTLHVSTAGGDLAFDLNFALTISPRAQALVAIEFGIGISRLGLNVNLPPLELDFDLGTLFDVEVSSGDRSQAITKTEGPPANPPGMVPAKQTHGDTTTQAGESNDALSGLQSGSKDQGGEPGGLAKLMKQAQLLSQAAGGLQGLSTLVKLAIEGITAFMVAGPFGFAAWALWQLVTGGIGKIETACAQIQAGIEALRELLKGFEDDPNMKWLADALLLLDSKADDNARKQVYLNKHIGAPVEAQANLLRAMYAGHTATDDELCILRIMRDAPDLEALLIATSGELKAGIDEALGELQGYTDTRLCELFNSRGFGRVMNMGDDIYAREVVANGTFKDMSTAQRAKLLVMVTTGRVPTADELAALRIMEFSKDNGDLGGVLTIAYGSVSDAMDQISSGMHGSSYTRYKRAIASWFGKAFLPASERWADQIAGLPAHLRQRAAELLDETVQRGDLNVTFDRALERLVTETPFNKPLSAPLAENAWQILNNSAPSVAGLTAEERPIFVKAVHGGDLRHIKRRLTVAVLKGKNNIAVERPIAEFLQKLRNPDGE